MGEVKDLNALLHLFHCIGQGTRGGGNGALGVCVCVMGAMWQNNSVFVSDSDQPRLAKQPEEYNLLHHLGCVIWVMGGLPYSLH